METYNIFLSHTHDDANWVREFDDVVGKKLKSIKEITVEIDIFLSSKPNKIPLGANWYDTVVHKLDNTHLLIVFLSKKSISKPWVWFEVGYFVQRLRAGAPVRLYPLLVDKVDISKTPIAHVQAMSFSSPAELGHAIGYQLPSHLMELFGHI
jgi:hypothetical protein